MHDDSKVAAPSLRDHVKAGYDSMSAMIRPVDYLDKQDYTTRSHIMTVFLGVMGVGLSLLIVYFNSNRDIARVSNFNPSEAQLERLFEQASVNDGAVFNLQCPCEKEVRPCVNLCVHVASVEVNIFVWNK
jgi:hypothetical protein